MIDSNIVQLLIPVAQAVTEATPVAGEVAKTSGGVLGTLGIDWRYFIAQLVNFGLVLFVLWKWVLTPVAKKLTERSEQIEQSMLDATSTKREKEEFAVWKEQEMTKTRQEASSIITTAQKEATASKDEILLRAKEDQLKLVEQAKRQIEQEKTAQLQSAKAELADIITSATEKILKAKLDEKKDKELIKESLKNI